MRNTLRKKAGLMPRLARLSAFVLMALLLHGCGAAGSTSRMTETAAGATTAVSTAATGSTTSADAASGADVAALDKIDSAATEETILPTGPSLTFIGHATLMIVTSEGRTIYVDPYAEGDYSRPADLILVSHEDYDHNVVKRCTKAEGCVVLRTKDTIGKDGAYIEFDAAGVHVKPVPAENAHHSVKQTNGFVLSFDGLTIYHASDTSKLPQMADLKALEIDYAFYPIDGKYNMDAAEAMECAAIVGAKHNTPIHFFEADPAAFTPEGLLYMEPGSAIPLVTE